MEAADAGGGGGGTLGGAAQVAGQMESEQDAMASPAAKQIAAAQPLLPDEILEDIFLLLDSGADLARASASCRSFRRVATGHRFLRRFLSLHPPPIVGFVLPAEGFHTFHPAEQPRQSASAARGVAQAGDFTFSFLPSDPHPNRRWIVQDVRDGRFLLARRGTVDTAFLEFVVCDPLYRRYVLVPSIPGDLVLRMPSNDEMKSEPFLAPSSDKEKTDEDQHFRVIYHFVSTYEIVTLVFSAAAGKWCGVIYFSLLPDRLILRPQRLVRYYARSCFYWMHRSEKYTLIFDPFEMEFSLIELLHERNRLMDGKNYSELGVMDAAEGRLGLVALGAYTRKLDIYSRTCQNNGAVGAEEWRHDKHITLPESDYFYSIIGEAKGHILLLWAKPYDLVREKQHFAVTVNLETFLVEKLCASNDSKLCDDLPYSYSSFPPPLSLPRLLN